MNVNPILLVLKDITGLPVTQDVYEGKGDKWITFTYEDERPGQIGDNSVTDDIAYMQVNLFTPKRFDYMELKEKIKSYLESIGVVTGIRSWCYEDKQILIRQTTFTAEITAEREE